MSNTSDVESKITDAQDASISGESRLKKMRRWVRSRFNEDVGEEIQELIESRDSSPDTHLSDQERELIASVLNFSKVDADTACVPRSDVAFVSKDASVDDVLDVFSESGFSRIPVCGKDLDEVLGFVTFKDIVPYIRNNGAGFALRKLTHPCPFVPETLLASAVLAELRKHKTQMAIVVDEYGGTTGLITLTDILEELVGDIEYEVDNADEMLVQKLNDRRYRIDPRVEINALDSAVVKALGADLKADYDTVGGFVLAVAGCVPEAGASYQLDTGNKLIVTEADARRIKEITLTLVDADGGKKAKTNKAEDGAES